MNAPVTPVLSVTASPAECYTVRNGWSWAHIFVRHGVRQEDRGPCTWAHVAVISDYGSFGYCWTHIGNSPWQAFLAGLDFHYAMRKFLGAGFRTPLTSGMAAEKARQLVLDQRRRSELSREAARELFDAIEWCGPDGTANDFLREWDRHSSGAMYRNEMFLGTWDEPSPQAVGFWENVWPHFIAALGTATEDATQHGASLAREARTGGAGGDDRQRPDTDQADLLSRLQSAERERDGANDERDAAERKADRASALAVEWFERAQSAERDRDALKAERDALLTALEPFANTIPRSNDGDARFFGWNPNVITYGDCLRAHTLTGGDHGE